MYRLYEKVPITEEYAYGMKLLESDDNPFKVGPCLLSMIAIAMWEKDINGALTQGMEALRLKTNHNDNTGIELEEFKGRILSLAYGESSEQTTMKGKKMIGGISRKEILDDEFTQKYLFPLIEDDGKKIDVIQAMRNMRNVNIMTYCGATQSALRMEECLINRMYELGYTEEEISQIQSQMCIIGYATDVKMRTEIIHKKKIKSTCLSFGDVNDGDVSAPQGIKENAKENNTVYYDEGYYFHYGNGKHSLKDYILQNDALSVGISSTLTKALSNSISNAQSKEFKPLTKEVLTEDIEKIIDGIRQGKKREELMTLVDNSINYGIDKKDKIKKESESNMTKVNEMIQKAYSFEEYKQFIVNETPEVIQELTDIVISSYSKQKDLREKIKGEDDSDEKELLKSALQDERKIFVSVSKILSDFILKHQNDSEYIENIINQMPFMNRASFINEAVLSMLSKGLPHEHVEMTNALDIFERSIDREIRERLKNESFEDLCKELFLEVSPISHPRGYRTIVPKYDCINFSLYRLDQELGKGIYSNQISKLTMGGGLRLYEFDRDIYEDHKAPNLREGLKGKDRLRKEWIEDTYWVQKITEEDKERLGISDFPDLEQNLFGYSNEQENRKNWKKEYNY